MQATEAKHLSFSQVNQLRTCSWQYKLTRVDRVEERPSVPAVAGQVIHKATEEIDRLIHAGNTDTNFIEGAAQVVADASLVDAIAEKSEAGWAVNSWKYFGNQHLEWFETTGIPRSIGAYLDWRQANPHWVLVDVPGHGAAIEVPFEYFIAPTLPVRGYIDRIFADADTGELLVVDIKSGKKPKSSEQLGLYAAALREGLGWEVATGYYVYGLKTGQASLTNAADLSVWTPTNLGRLYWRSQSIIIHSLFVPNPGDNCFFACSVPHACEFSRATI